VAWTRVVPQVSFVDILDLAIGDLDLTWTWQFVKVYLTFHAFQYNLNKLIDSSHITNIVYDVN